MIDNLLFHIGDAKTGTSSIQWALKKKAWVCDSVRIVTTPEPNAINMARSLNWATEKRDANFAPKAQWARENTGDLGIISSEFFASAKPEALREAVSVHMPRYVETMRMIAYARPHASLILSSYAQRVKTGRVTIGFDEFVDDVIGFRGRFRMVHRFGPWRDVFGNRFILRPFIREELHRHDVVQDFFNQVLQGAEFEITRSNFANESLSVEVLSMMKLIQQALVETGNHGQFHDPIGSALMRLLRDRPAPQQTRLRLDRANAEKIARAFEDDARTTDARFFEGEPITLALHDSTKNTVDSPPVLDAALYYDPAIVAEIQGEIKAAANLLAKAPKAWLRSYRVRKGQKSASLIDAMPGPQAANAREVWQHLENIADLLVLSK